MPQVVFLTSHVLTCLHVVQELKPLVFGAIMDALNSGKPLVEAVESHPV